MISLLERAIHVATLAHAGQVDKLELPYILHPLAVALSIPFTDIDARIVAVLHDVVEDTDTTLEDLSKWLPHDLLVAVDAMTKRKGETLEAYWGRVKSNPIALRVKLADIAHNTSPERMAHLPTADRERLEKKYAKALAFLNS